MAANVKRGTLEPEGDGDAPRGGVPPLPGGPRANRVLFSRFTTWAARPLDDMSLLNPQRRPKRARPAPCAGEPTMSIDVEPLSPLMSARAERCARQ